MQKQNRGALIETIFISFPAHAFVRRAQSIYLTLANHMVTTFDRVKRSLSEHKQFNNAAD